jgi:hypothetical protein
MTVSMSRIRLRVRSRVAPISPGCRCVCLLGKGKVDMKFMNDSYIKYMCDTLSI